MHVHLKNQVGMVKECKVGFSWTTFFFGIFPALTRGDWKWALIQFVAAACTAGLSAWIFCFIYNKLYIKDLLEKGYVPASEQDRQVLVQKGILADSFNA